jgi:hypothetical protein
MVSDSNHTCHWCHGPVSGNRKFCCRECRNSAQESKVPDPTLEEIREMCCRIREEGGEAWERSHTCYTPQRVQVPVVTVRRCCLSGVEQ